jgi:crotonobetainyl-CoA:carnitine CoA-transferase CaiB-like acyl-CoA transferase
MPSLTPPPQQTPVAGALQGVRVLDLSRVLAGPWSTQILADLGADVVKVERPGTGDDTRAWGPPFAGTGTSSGSESQESAYYLSANRNKRSIALDLHDPTDQATLRALALEAHVVVENYKRGDLERFELGPQQLLALKPSLVVCSITGYGHTGPMRDEAGYDFAIQAQGGLMSVTGAPDGEPQKVGVAVADLSTGLYAAIGILAALRHAEATGQGQHVDLALLDVQVAMLANLGASHLVSGAVPQRLGNAHPTIVPYQAFATADHPLVVAVGNDRQFAAFCHVLERDWHERPEYATNPERVRHRATLTPQIAERLREQPRGHWLAALHAAKVPCGPVQRIDEAVRDPQVLAREMLWPSPHPAQPDLMLVGSPLRLSATPTQWRRSPPQLDADRETVLRDWLGR